MYKSHFQPDLVAWRIYTHKYKEILHSWRKATWIEVRDGALNEFTEISDPTAYEQTGEKRKLWH
jgi:hypothetical protein